MKSHLSWPTNITPLAQHTYYFIIITNLGKKSLSGKGMNNGMVHVNEMKVKMEKGIRTRTRRRQECK